MVTRRKQNSKNLRKTNTSTVQMEYIRKYSTILQLVLLHAFATTPLESVF